MYLVWEVYLFQECVPGLGGYLVPGWGCTWSGVQLVRGGGGVPGLGGIYLVRGWVYLVQGGTWSGGYTWSGGVAPGLGGGGYLVRYSPPVNRMNDRHV